MENDSSKRLTYYPLIASKTKWCLANDRRNVGYPGDKVSDMLNCVSHSD